MAALDIKLILSKLQEDGMVILKNIYSEDDIKAFNVQFEATWSEVCLSKLSVCLKIYKPTLMLLE